jgi:hypothetical protein
MKEPENKGPKTHIRLDGHVRLPLPDRHPANRRGMPDYWGQTCRRLQA